ncbi:MAG: GAF domain-containing sensor histidine kinase [Anaerolineae bacterium]|nr:GAF domain-containing sensor histidine kinase [Anaerolineae bacterium]
MPDEIAFQVAELEKKVVILAQLAEISAALNSHLELEPLLSYIMEVATRITSCEAASVLLWDQRTQQLVFEASTTQSRHSSKLIGKPVPMDSIAGLIFASNDIVQVDDTRLDPRHYDKVDNELQFETRSLLGVPMTYKDRVIGVLEAINKRSLPWTDDDRNYLRILAAQAAVAIAGAQQVMALRQANEEMKEVDKLKNNFIAIASHELRTPLGVIMGYASFLQMHEDEATQDHANKVMESALKLRKIIDDMVNLRYLKQKQSDLYMEDTTLAQVINTFRFDAVTLIDGSRQHIHIVPPEVDIAVKVDFTRMNMALTNMLNNALSFTPPEGSITLFGDEHDGYARIIMTDTGIGIDPDQLERIFEEFYQVEDHMTRRHGGLGIGLSIARAIVEAHGGTISAASRGRAKGATFTIRLPLTRAAGNGGFADETALQ